MAIALSRIHRICGYRHKTYIGSSQSTFQCEWERGHEALALAEELLVTDGYQRKAITAQHVWTYRQH